jgi:spoIIIJ-associated protein
MTDWIEASGKTLEEAKEAAANELGVAVDELEVEVIEEAAKGLFGLGQHKVRIKAAVTGREASSEPVAEASATETVPKAARATAILEQIFEAMEFEARPVLISEDEVELQIDVQGATEDLGRLIGRHGQTLDALQYLVGIAINRYDYNKVRVTLDAEGYRERHRQLLEEKALDFAKQVVDTGSEAVFEPQSARDRRIVHMALAGHPDVMTYSEGDGEDRHVVISPKK